MHNFLKNTLLFALLVFSGATLASANHPDEQTVLSPGEGAHEQTTTHTEEEFDAATHAIHHVLDAHEIHIADAMVIPLPVILWTDKGLVTFMSSEFHHDDEG